MSRFLPERFAVVVVVIAASLRYPRGAFFLAFLGKMSLTYASLSISFTMVKSSDCIVRSWLNTGIYSAVTIIPTGYEHSCYARTSSLFVYSLLVLCCFQKWLENRRNLLEHVSYEMHPDLLVNLSLIHISEPTRPY